MPDFGTKLQLKELVDKNRSLYIQLILTRTVLCLAVGYIVGNWIG